LAAASVAVTLPLGRFVRNTYAAFGQQFLDVAVAGNEALIKPDGVADDVRREPVAALAMGVIPNYVVPFGSRQRSRDRASGAAAG
jgi:hypothetical protein